MYLTQAILAELMETEFYSLDCQNIGLLARNTLLPVIDLLVLRFVAQSKFEKALRFDYVLA